MDRPPPGFEIVEHTADVALRGWAPDLASLCAVMARALFEVIANVSAIVPRVHRDVEVTAETPPDLLHDWLEELNALHQIHGEVYGAYDVRVKDLTLRARVSGEPLDTERHDPRLEVKAVTWHDLRVEQGPDGFTAYVLLDI